MSKEGSETVAFRQSVPSLGLSVERGTEAVPADGAYYVVLDGEILFRFLSKVRALAEYRSRRQELSGGLTKSSREIDREAVVKRIRAEMDFRALHSEAARSKATKARRKGGKGGSGGVAR
jgi:hypothetical protein